MASASLTAAGWGDGSMIMTDLAIRDLETRRDTVLDRCRQLLVSLLGRESNHQVPAIVAEHQPAPPRIQAVPRRTQHDEAAGGDMRWQRHPQLRSRQVEPASMPGSQRSARLAAERGLILARGGKLIEAVEAFTTAARDERIDLGSLPGFWDLPRNGMLTAVRAYERADRVRDATALDARIRHLLQPRPLKPVPTAPSPRRLTASGD